MNSLVAAVAFDALGGAEALAVVGVAHAGVAVTLAGWTQKQGNSFSFRLSSTSAHASQTDGGGTSLSSFYSLEDFSGKY